MEHAFLIVYIITQKRFTVKEILKIRNGILGNGKRDPETNCLSIPGSLFPLTALIG